MTSSQLILSCPLCQSPLDIAEGQPARCENGHSFDRARQGYLNLLPAHHKKSKHPGDDSKMVEARTRFLDKGYYQPIADSLNATVSELCSNSLANPQNTDSENDKVQIADVGCGEGYYSHQLSQTLTKASIEHQLYAVDISKDAIKAACRRTGKRSAPIHWLVASGGKLPLLANQLDLVVSLFTPVMPEGWKAALKPGGKVILAIPNQHHLIELRKILYAEVKETSFDPSSQLEKQGFKKLTSELVQTEISVDQQDLPSLLEMTPHGWRATPEVQRSVMSMPVLETRIDVELSCYQFL